MTLNSRVGVSRNYFKKMMNGLLTVAISELSSISGKEEGSENMYFSTGKPHVYFENL